MPNIDPKIAFYLGLFLCVVTIVFNGGPTFLQGAIPAGAIIVILAWCKIISGIGTGIMTYIAGQNMTNAGRLANVQPVPLPDKLNSLVKTTNGEIKQIVTTQAVADAVPSDKVVSK